MVARPKWSKRVVDSGGARNVRRAITQSVEVWMSIPRLDLKAIEGDDARVEAFVAALTGESAGSTADDATASASAASTEAFTASGKATGKPQVTAGWVPQLTASGKVEGKQPV